MSYRWSCNDQKADDNSGSMIAYASDHQPSSHRVAHQSSNKASSNEQTAAVRSRWSPKPEQILILESVFNSGMVNPPKDETVRIRMLLENFGPVGDANVFYWFQNRRSRSRRLHRQIQADMIKSNSADRNTLHYNNPSSFHSVPSTYTCLGAGGSSSIGSVEGFLAADQMGLDQDIYDNGSLATADSSSFFCSSYNVTNPYFPYQQHGGVVDDQGGFMTVFINGTATEVPMGPVDMRELCGQEFVLVHSSGHPVPANEYYGFSTYSLQHGESYFLVDKSI